MAGVISVSSVIAITSALLVYQLGQPRIWMTMSRDGLLWKRFSKIHPKYQTPSFATIITGLVVGIPALFFRMDFFVDLTSVGTFSPLSWFAEVYYTWIIRGFLRDPSSGFHI